MSRISETLTFDGLGVSETAVPNGYGGLDWDNVYVKQPTNTEQDGFANDLRSGDSVAYNGFATAATIRGSHFYLKSGYFAAALENNVTVTFTAHRDGVVSGEVTKVLNEQSHLIRFPASFNHAWRVVITTDNPDNPTESHLAMENLVVRVGSSHAASAGLDVHHPDGSHALDPLEGLSGHHAGDFLV